jgi:hypothetical protein
MPQTEPLDAELAPPPREQAGPFLLLGLDKGFVPEDVEAHWARRVVWARRQQTKVPLEDINWAREVLRDAEARLKADLESINVDTGDRILARLAEAYGVAEGGRPAWEPREPDARLTDSEPALELPDPEALRAGIRVPEVPDDLPAAAQWLRERLAVSVDPWDLGELERGEP